MNERQQILVQRGEDTLSMDGVASPSEWRSLPKHAAKERKITLVLSFESEEERNALVAELGITPSKTWKATWPPGDDDLRLDV